MAAQLAENLLAVLWMDRCRQTQLLAQGGANVHQVAHTILAPFITGQRWGVATQVMDDEGDLQIEGVLNFDPSGWRVDLDHAHVIEQGIFVNLVRDVGRGEWMPIEGYIRRAEFFGGLPRGSIRRLPPGAPRR